MVYSLRKRNEAREKNKWRREEKEQTQRASGGWDCSGQELNASRQGLGTSSRSTLPSNRTPHAYTYITPELDCGGEFDLPLTLFKS